MRVPYYDKPHTLDIFEQQTKAYNVLEKVHLVDNKAVVAGGAPRDWRLGKVANDIDIYLYFDMGIEQASELIKAITGIHTRRLGTELDINKSIEYSEMKGLRWVLEGVYEGETIQFMGMETSIVNVRDFSCSICEYYCRHWTGSKKFGIGNGFAIGSTASSRLTEETGIIFIKDDICDGKHAKHFDKMYQRFSGTYSFLPKSMFNQVRDNYKNKVWT